ncbi:uncharacterized protein LOC126843573 isoform X2 [Adelges cooleyi]|uniref:uncharacterized protein LOC126843573 isoform X2 n=1 Tax=Adelges cooleyi TaxID=133065 RepID=UPI00217F8838|nr:uncharacterized protein LOC126843573 isoform X2 [Adelges cooleyi]
MNVRGAAASSSTQYEYSSGETCIPLTQLEFNRTLAVLSGRRSIRTGPSPVANNGRHWTPSRSRENAETVKYIQQVVQACKIVKPWTGEETAQTQPLRSSVKIKMNQLPRIMQKILSNRIRNSKEQRETDCWTPSEFVNDSLFWHNFYRRFHRSTDLILSASLCQEAQNWANYLAHTDTFAYQNKTVYGQNLFCRKLTDKANNLNGPFTQLIWADTKQLGVGKSISRSGRLFVVANYYPKGNINGQYSNNIHVNKYFECFKTSKLDLMQ